MSELPVTTLIILNRIANSTSFHLLCLLPCYVLDSGVAGMFIKLVFHVNTRLITPTGGTRKILKVFIYLPTNYLLNWMNPTNHPVFNFIEQISSTELQRPVRFVTRQTPNSKISILIEQTLRYKIKEYIFSLF